MKRDIALIKLFLDDLNNELNKEIVKNKGVRSSNIAYFDMMKTTVLFAHIMYYGKHLNAVFLGDDTINEMIEIIYSDNIGKIKNSIVHLSKEEMFLTYPEYDSEFFPDEDPLYEKFINNYLQICSNKKFAKDLILATIKETMHEIKDFTSSYGKFYSDSRNPTDKLQVPVAFFFNCFIHPHILVSPKDYAYYCYREAIDKYSFNIYLALQMYCPATLQSTINR